jgi:enoyl-CoA hydratase/carnithine racemase
LENHIRADADKGVLTIRIDRPEKKNALTGAMYAALAAALDRAFADDAIRAVLLFGRPGVFTAGNDIGDFLAAATSGMRGSTAVFDFLERIILAQKPLVAGVDGLAIGVGTTMLFHCDHVVASETSTFRTPFVDLGILPEAGSSLIGPRIMGHHRAFALLAMGDALNAAEARDAGFVNRVVAASGLEETALATARSIAAKPPQAMAEARALLRGDRSDVLARMRKEAEMYKARLASSEAKAAFMAFMQKGR